MLECKPSDKKFYTTDGKPNFQKIANSSNFISGIEQLVKITSKKRTAVMYAEKDPKNFHRAVIIEPVMKKHGFTMKHIRKTK